MMVFCNQCGSRNPDGSSFCSKCGAPLYREDTVGYTDHHIMDTGSNSSDLTASIPKSSAISRPLAFALILSVVAVVLCSAIFLASGSTDPVNDDPVEGDPVEPIVLSVDKETGVLTASSAANWKVFNELDMFVTEYTGASITLNPGIYSVILDDQQYNVIISGEVHREYDWTYTINGTTYPLSLSYDIDLEELGESIFISKEFNSDKSNYKFSNLPQFIDVNDTIVSIAESLRIMYVGCGGSLQDRQAYASFIVSSFQSICEGLPSSYDADIWGKDEYWAMPLETLFFMRNMHDGEEDLPFLIVSVLKAAGFGVALGGTAGHVFAAVALDNFREASHDDLIKQGISNIAYLCKGVSLTNPSDESVYYAIWSGHIKLPIGYALELDASRISTQCDTRWGTSGFYTASD